MITKVSSILRQKKIDNVLSVTPDTTVIQALEKMSEYNIGALLVIENEVLKGIFSERDYARKGILQGRKAKSTAMTEVMTANVYTVKETMNIKDCMELMSEKHFRHLPVVDDDGKVVGVLSISDVVSALIKEQRQHIKFLERYISG
jgi:CBS domain-containing protein